MRTPKDEFCLNELNRNKPTSPKPSEPPKGQKTDQTNKGELIKMTKEYVFEIYGPPEILNDTMEKKLNTIAEKYNGEWFNFGTAFDGDMSQRDIDWFFKSVKDRSKFKKEVEKIFKTDEVFFNIYTDEV